MSNYDVADTCAQVRTSRSFLCFEVPELPKLEEPVQSEIPEKSELPEVPPQGSPKPEEPVNPKVRKEQELEEVPEDRKEVELEEPELRRLPKLYEPEISEKPKEPELPSEEPKVLERPEAPGRASQGCPWSRRALRFHSLGGNRYRCFLDNCKHTMNTKTLIR